MSIFKYLDYRDLLKSEITNRKKVSSKITYSGLATAINVQKTLISKVLKGDANLNSDQIFLACNYLGLSETESDFVQLLLDYDRCAVLKRKALLKDKIKMIRDKELQPSRHLAVETMHTQDTDLQSFYLDPIAQLVHAFLIIPKYAAASQLIQKELQLTTQKMKATLELLERAQLIKIAQNSYVHVTKTQTHLSPNSQLHATYHQLIRMKSIDRLSQITNEQKYSFSVLMSTEEKAFEKLKALFLELLQSAHKHVTQSKPETVYQLNFDLFKW